MKNNKLNSKEKKIITLGALGGMLEFYDFVIYGIFSFYFAKQFFPSNNHLLSILESYGVFVVGYLARPLGGLIFSHIGDEFGRKKVLVITIALMGISSFSIGLLPTYAQIGFLAPVLLLFLRTLQGLALGGELPSTYVYISESIKYNLGFSFGILMSGVNSGLLLGMTFNEILTFILTEEQLISYGWRLPFIFGGLICFVSYRIRKALQESSAFTKIHNKPKFPLIHLFTHQFLVTIAGMFATSIMAGLVVTVIIFMPTYLHGFLNMDNKVISFNMFIMMTVNVMTIFLSGILVGRFRLTSILKCLLVACIILVPLSFWLLSISYLMLGLIIFAALQGVAAMTIPLFLTHLFPSKIRLTGVAICYNLSFTIFGGMAPIFITILVNQGYNIYLTPVLYLLLIIGIAAIGLLYAEKHSFKPPS